MTTLRSRWLSAVAALGEPTRRRLYEHVIAAGEPLSRDDAAAALELPRQTAAFHLDRLAREGLLDVVYSRRTGRSGPGAGRPAKLYRRSSTQVTVSLPERRYDLAGELLAGAIEQAERTGESPQAVAAELAFELGTVLARSAEDDQLVDVLAEYGFEPGADGDDVVLLNCPFHALARSHTDLMCGLNLRLLAGLVEAMPDSGLTPELDPAPNRCCVRLRG